MILSIDTCGPAGTVALARLVGDQAPALLAQVDLPGKTYSARLIPVIRDLLAAQGTAEIVAIVVTRGPGSFTGIRIGLSAAKGLAEAHNLPILAVSRLAVLASKARTAAAALDASRHEFYLGDYSDSAAGAAREALLTSDQFQQQASAFRHELAVCESAVHSLAPEAALVAAPTAADAILFALLRLRAGDYDDPVTLDGNYLRRSDAEIFSKPKLAPHS